MLIKITFLLLFPTLLLAENMAIENSELEKMIEGFNGKIHTTPRSSSLCSDAPPVKLLECSSDKNEQLESVLSLSRTQLARLQEEVKDFSKNPQVTTNRTHLKNISDITKTLKCIDKEINDVKFICKNSSICSTANAYVYSFFGFGPSTVNLCSGFWNSNNKTYKAAMILHEISHICGTEDHEYISYDGYKERAPGDEKSRTVTIKYNLGPPGKTTLFKNSVHVEKTNITASNGDTYEYWAIYGFCLPGLDCR